jgi:hypothetical protein
MMEAARTSETSVDIDLITRQYIPENSELREYLGKQLLCKKSLYEASAARNFPKVTNIFLSDAGIELSSAICLSITH